MNGAPWVLGLAGLAALAGATRRGSRALAVPAERRAQFMALVRDLDALIRRCHKEKRGPNGKQILALGALHGASYLGSGATRTVFGVPEGALKIERAPRRHGDNRREVTVWTDAPARVKQHLVPVLDHDEGYAWLLMPKVKTGGSLTYHVKEILDGCGLGDFEYSAANVSKDGRLLDYAFLESPSRYRRCLEEGRKQRAMQGSRAKLKPPTLRDLGLPTVWFHGTKASFTGKLKPNKGMGGACVWLADEAGARAYAGQGPTARLVRVELDPGTRVADLADARDPIVRDFIRRDRSASNLRWYNREEVTDEEMAEAIASWQRRTTHYDAIESRGWAKDFFRKAGVDALLVRDVQGWGGHQSMPSLCVLNRAKIAREQDVVAR